MVVKGSSAFDGGSALGDDGGMGELERGRVVVDLVDPAESVGGGEARDWELRRCDGAGGHGELGVGAGGTTRDGIVDEAGDEADSTAEGIEDGGVEDVSFLGCVELATGEGLMGVVTERDELGLG